MKAPEPIRLPAFVPCHPKDAGTLRLAVAGLRAHSQVGDITVVADRAMQVLCGRLGVGFFDERDVLPPWFSDADPYKHTRWYYQQLLKLGLSFTAAADHERYLGFDSDGVLLRDFPLVDPASGAVLVPRMSEWGERYATGMREVLGLDPVREGSHVAHFMVFRPRIVRAMVEACAEHAGRPAAEGLETLRDYLKRCDGVERAFSEYETYGYFARAHFPGELQWAERRQVNMLYVAPSPAVLERMRPWLDYCNFHAYRRPSSALQRIAGRAWLEALLARERAAARRSGGPVVHGPALASAHPV